MNKYDIVVIGAGPSAAFLAYEAIQLNKNKKILLIATGSLHSVLSSNLKLEMPGMSHAVSVEVKY